MMERRPSNEPGTRRRHALPFRAALGVSAGAWPEPERRRFRFPLFDGPCLGVRCCAPLWPRRGLSRAQSELRPTGRERNRMRSVNLIARPTEESEINPTAPSNCPASGQRCV